jgi:hypothetical protein
VRTARREPLPFWAVSSVSNRHQLDSLLWNEVLVQSAIFTLQTPFLYHRYTVAPCLSSHPSSSPNRPLVQLPRRRPTSSRLPPHLHPHLPHIPPPSSRPHFTPFLPLSAQTQPPSLHPPFFSLSPILPPPTQRKPHSSSPASPTRSASSTTRHAGSLLISRLAPHSLPHPLLRTPHLTLVREIASRRVPRRRRRGGTS